MTMVRLIDNTDPRLPRLQPHGWAGPAEHIRALLLVSAAAAAIAGWPAAATAAGKLTRVSVGIGGAEANGGSGGATISANGHLVAFTSAASNLVPGDTNSASDVFVRDLQAGTTERVSVATGGAQGNGDSGDFYAPSMSADGRFVTFRSAATNLVKDDTNRYADIFVRDRQKGTTVRVSVSSGGVQANDESFQPVISAAGRFVVFSTPASNLVVKDTNSDFDVFLRDLEAGKTERVSVASGGAQGKGFSTPGGISSNGRGVIFWSDAPNLIKGDKNGEFDVFLRDRRTKKTTLVSISSSGAKANASNRGGWISGDGRYVVFESSATNLTSNDTNGTEDVYVRDLKAGTTERVSVATGGGQGNDSSTVYQFASPRTITQDGRYVVFSSLASNLAPGGDSNGGYDLFLRDRKEHVTHLVSASPAGTPGNSSSFEAAISGDGSRVAFGSNASDLVAGDTNGVSDIFVLTQ